MALIGKIRQRTGLLLGFIGLALVIFLVEAALNSNSLLSRAGGGNVGKIGKTKIAASNFQEKYQAFENTIKTFNPNLELNDENLASIRGSVWDDMIFETLLGGKLNKLGIQVTDMELAESIKGDMQHPLAQQFFSQINGGKPLSKEELAQLYKNIDKNDKEGKLRESLLMLEDLIVNEKRKNKYLSLISKGAYVPNFIAKNSMENNKMASISYASIPYTTIDDKTIKVSDDEIKEYINAHKYNYRTDATRTLDVVEFALKPTTEDINDIYAKLNEVISEYKSTTNDSLFLARRSMQGSNLSYYTAEDIQGKNYADSIISGSVGSFIGPYTETNNKLTYLVMTKIIDRKIVADSASAAHILLTPKTPEEYEAMKKQADTLAEQLRGNLMMFGQKASELSMDEGSKKQGGNLGVFPKGAMVKPFNDAVFYDMRPGQIKVVESQFGIHIILLTGLKGGKPATKFADFGVPMVASDNTEKDISEKARKFMAENNTPEKFDKAAKSQISYPDVTVYPDDYRLGNAGMSRETIKWAFNQKKVGEMYMANLEDKILLVKVDKIKKEGLPSVDDVRTDVTEKIMTKKKGEQLVKKLNGAGASSLADIAAKTGAIIKDSVTIQFSSDFVDGAGIEPSLVGAAFGTPQGKISKAVAGNSGAFVVLSKNIIKQEIPLSLAEYKNDLTRRLLQGFSYAELIENLKKSNQIENNLYKFF
jgi:peptidyl-prolyl cis-trans isomerase D